MAASQAIPPIPPLSVKQAHQLEAIEGNLARALEHCMDMYGKIANELKTKTYLSSYVVKIFVEYLQAYVASPNLRLWIPELKTCSVKWALGCLADYRGVTPQDIDKYADLLLDTLDNYMESTFGNSANPILAALAEVHPDAKQAGAYARAGIDLSSASPLLAKLHTAAQANRTDEQQPQRGSREALVLPILEAKGWSVLDWATDAEVAYHTADDYLKGKRRPYRSTIKKLAESLGLTVQQLPR